MGPDALADVLRVEDGAVVAGGATYRLLYLGGSSERMTLPTLLAIERLLDRGATVVGVRPAGSPSLGDDVRAVDAACDRIWSEQRTDGRVIATSDLRAALDELGMRPALEVDGAPIRQIGRVIDGRRLTFLANPSADPVEFRVLVDDPSRPLVAWDPVELRTEALPADATASDDDRVAYRVSLPAFGSVFVLAADERPPTASVVHSIPLGGAWELHAARPPAHRDAHRAEVVDRRRRRRACLLGQRHLLARVHADRACSSRPTDTSWTSGSCATSPA